MSMAPSVVSGSRPLLNPPRQPSRDNRRAGEAIAPRDRHAFRIETGGQAVEEHRPVHVVLDVLFARPDHFDGTVDVFGDLDGALDAVALQPPAEAAADQMVVHHDLVQRQAGDLRGRALGAGERLIADPDLATVRGEHEPCSSSAPWSHARGTGRGRSLRPWSPHPASPGDVADVLRDHARLERGLFELVQ